jgi:hypothetical protein
MIPILNYFERKEFLPILEDNIFWRCVTVAPQYGTSGLKLKKSLGEGRADIHGYQTKQKRKELDDGFFM